MPREFVQVSLLRHEAEAARQAFQNNIEWFFANCSGCQTTNNNRRGCQAHSKIITSLKDMRRRMFFQDGPVVDGSLGE